MNHDNANLGVLGGITGAVFKGLLQIQSPDFTSLFITTVFSAFIGAAVGLAVKEVWQLIKVKHSIHIKNKIK